MAIKGSIPFEPLGRCEGGQPLVRKFSKRGFALGMVVALPVSLLLWGVILWIVLR